MDEDKNYKHKYPTIGECFFCGCFIVNPEGLPEDPVCQDCAHCNELSGAEKLLVIHKKKKEKACTTSATEPEK
jgi:hypothetical protein